MKQCVPYLCLRVHAIGGGISLIVRELARVRNRFHSPYNNFAYKNNFLSSLPM